MEQNTLFVTRKINVDAEQLFDFWTDKSSLQQALPPTNDDSGNITGELGSEGDSFQYLCSNHKGEPCSIQAEVKRVVKNEQITWSWRDDSWQGQRSFITMSIEPISSSSCLINIEHRGLPSSKDLESYQNEWESFLNFLASSLEQGVEVRSVA